jgi:hypothetical protein
LLPTRTAAHFSFVVTRLELDWVVPLATLSARGMVEAGIALAILGFGVNVWFSTRVTIGRDAGEIYFCVTRLWESRRRAPRTVVTDGELRHWHTWNCRGIELRGADALLVAVARGGRRLSPPPALQAVLGNAPAVRVRCNALFSNLPNLLLACMSLIGVGSDYDGITAVMTLVCWSVIATTLASSLRGAPLFSVRTAAAFRSR